MYTFKKTETGIIGRIFFKGSDGWCRHCHGIGNAADFQKPREVAATMILKKLFLAPAHTTLVEYSRWTEAQISEAIMRKVPRGASAPDEVTCDLAEEFGIFIYALIACGLSALAGLLMRVTMLLAAVMHSLGVSMLLPQQVFYMLSSDPHKHACGRSLAAVLSACGRHILSKEEERKKAPGAVAFEEFDSAGVRQNSLIHVALVAFDGGMNAPTHDLIQATAKLFAQDKSMRTWLVVRTHLARQELEAGEQMPYDTNSASVSQLIDALGEHVVYICKDDSPETVVNKLRGLRLNVLVHIGGYNYQHFWSILVMAQVAEVYVEWLSMASLLLCWKLARCLWTISSWELVTQEQYNHRLAL